jgi:hypothetical protein
MTAPIGRATTPSRMDREPTAPACVSATPNSCTKYTAIHVPTTTLSPNIAAFARPRRHTSELRSTRDSEPLARGTRGSHARHCHTSAASAMGTAHSATAPRHPTRPAMNGSTKMAPPMPSCMAAP